MKEEEDVSLWHTKHSYKDSNFGMEWCNSVLNKYGKDKWCVTCDPDEFLVYPKIEHRKLQDLTNWMDSMNQPSLFCVMIDCYSDKDIDKTYLNNKGDTFKACPYFDKFNFTQRYSSKFNNVWIQGGVRMRKHFQLNPQNAPAQNKVPLIKWRIGYKYLSSMHHTNTPSINCTIYDDNRFVSGAIMHFKYTSAFKNKVTEEITRKQHYNNSQEYKKYSKEGFDSLYDKNWSIKYTDSTQLVKLKMIHEGEWF